MSVYSVRGNELKNVFATESITLESCRNLKGEVIYNLGEFVVMTYNVQWWSKINAIADVTDTIINTHNPDVIGFQEYKDKATYLNGFGFTDIQISNSKYATNLKCVASKHKLSEVTEKTFDVHGRETRSYQKMYINVGSKKICLINVHLDYIPQDTQISQAKELFELVQNEEYFIIMGDLNTFCKSVSDADYIDMMAQFDNAGYHLANCSEQYGFLNTWSDGVDETATDWWQTDNVITSGNIVINKVIVDKTKITAATGQNIDHLPLIARLTIN